MHSDRVGQLDLGFLAYVARSVLPRGGGKEGRKEGRRSTFGGACRRDSAWTEVEVVAVGGGRRASAAGGTTRPTDERRAPRASEELRGTAPGPHMLLLPIGPC
jgi:hypothetical protein